MFVYDAEEVASGFLENRDRTWSCVKQGSFLFARHDRVLFRYNHVVFRHGHVDTAMYYLRHGHVSWGEFCFFCYFLFLFFIFYFSVFWSF